MIENDPNCVFCKIIHNEIPNTVVYEDDVVKAFLDLTQTTPGHTLVVPKVHVPDIFDYSAQRAGDVFSRIPMIARAIKASDPKIKGINIINNNGEVAYQSVFHSHFHLIPRYSDQDSFSISFTDHSDQYKPEDLTKIATNIQSHLED